MRPPAPLTRGARTAVHRTFHAKSPQRARVPPFVIQQLAQNARGSNPIWRQPLFRYGAGIAVAGGGAYYVSHLEKVELTNRRRLMTITPEQEAEASKTTYEAIMQQYGNQILSEFDPKTRFVNKVVRPLIRASGLTDLSWEVHVIQSEEPNAFVIPGGKIFVFSGILPIAENEDGLAAVLGHEIGHQVARHIAEKMSFNPILQIAEVLLSTLLLQFSIPPQFAFQLGGNLTSLVLDNPYSRMQETEADHIGLLIMAQACFNPQEAIRMWERMSKSGAQGVPQFMSTHPSNENRIVKLQGWMEEALKKQESSDCKQSLGGMLGEFRDRQKHANW